MQPSEYRRLSDDFRGGGDKSELIHSCALIIKTEIWRSLCHGIESKSHCFQIN